LLVGAALYWGEGGKTKTGMARIANSDPSIIRFMMKFFREVFNVPEKKFRGHIHTFSHLNAGKAEHYWSQILQEYRAHNSIKLIQNQALLVREKRTACHMARFKYMYVTQASFFKLKDGWKDWQSSVAKIYHREMLQFIQ
jgi:hypothetical protein